MYFIPRFLTEPCSGNRDPDQRMANTAHTAESTYTRTVQIMLETRILPGTFPVLITFHFLFFRFVIGTDWSACWILQNCNGLLSIVAYPIFRAHFKFTGPTRGSATDRSKHLMPAVKSSIKYYTKLQSKSWVPNSFAEKGHTRYCGFIRGPHVDK